MAMEVTVDRRKAEVQGAILQFAARREYRLFNAWWLDGQRLETQDAPESVRRRPTSARSRVVAVFRRIFDVEQRPRIDIELKSRRGKTTVLMNIGSHRKSVHLAYELRSYLEDERGYLCECPPMCPRCSAVVRNMTACFCGRCGESLTAAETPRARITGKPEDRADAQREIEPAGPEAAEDSTRAVAVERDESPHEAPERPAETESAIVDAEPDDESEAAEVNAAVAYSREATGGDEPADRDADEDRSEVTTSDTPPIMDDKEVQEAEEEDLRRDASPVRRALAED